MPMYKHILFATDLSDEIQNIVKKVKRLAKLYNAKLSAVHVVEHLAAIAYSYMGSIDVEEQLVNEAQKQMKTLAKELAIDEKNQYIEIGHPKTEILALAASKKVDLIVVGSHGRHGISALLGSTTNGIIHSSACDVLVVRAESEKNTKKPN